MGAGQDEDIQALVEKALAMFKESGAKATLMAINNGNGQFRKDDLYVFAITSDNDLLGHPETRIDGKAP